jgi:CheY-like chemotaxis protein
MQTIRDLQDRNLIALAQTDRFEMELGAQLQRFAVSVDSPQATAGMLSLRKSGYYVEIARGQARRAPPADGRALTAVVVEDEPILAKFIQTYLSLEGFEVRLAANRAEVVQQLNGHRLPDLVLLDVGLPDVDGFDILARLRQLSAFAHVPVIMLTGMATREAVIRGLEAGANGYVTKPFQPDALMRAVRTVLGMASTDAADPWGSGDGALTRKWQLSAGAPA